MNSSLAPTTDTTAERHDARSNVACAGNVECVLSLMLTTVSALALALVPLPTHSNVLDTTPGADEVLTTLPDTFAVVANEDVVSLGGAETTNRIEIVDAAGRFYGDGCTTVDGTTLSTAAALGEPGAYTMRYQLVSADGHPIEGSVPFTWAPTTDAGVSEGQATAPVCGAAAPSSEPTESATPSPTVESTSAPATSDESADESTPTPSASQEGEASTDQQDPTLFIVLGVLGLLAVGGGIAFAMRNRARGSSQQ